MNSTGKQINLDKAGPLAFGCMGLHPDKREASLAAVGKALERGCIHFDNADLYPAPALAGKSEMLLGEALSLHKVERESIFITSKCAIVFPQQRLGSKYKVYDTSAGHVRESVENSLRRMRTDYLDLFYLHRIDYLSPPWEVGEVLESLRCEGKIRAVGLSNYDVHQTRAFAAYCRVDALQLHFNLLRQNPLADGTHALATEWKIPFFAWSPLASGRLARVGEGPPDWVDQREEGVVVQLQRQAELLGVTLSQLALAWLQHLPGPVVPIVGSLNPAHLEAAFGASAVSIPRDVWYQLMVIGRGHPMPYHPRPVVMDPGS